MIRDNVGAHNKPVEDFRVFVSLMEARQPNSPLVRLFARALDLYDAASATGDAEIIRQVAQFIDRLTEGILIAVPPADEVETLLPLNG